MAEHKIVISNEQIRGDKQILIPLLEAKHPRFVDVVIEPTEIGIEMVSLVEETVLTWSCVKNLPTDEKLRLLLNVGALYEQLKDAIYTYTLNPEHIVFDVNGMPRLIYRGIVNQVPPYNSLTEAEFVLHYKALVISILDTRVDYQTLVEGKLDFYKGHLFNENLKEIETVAGIINEVTQYHQQEVLKNKQNQTTVNIKKWRQLRILSWTSGFVALVLLVLAYFVWFWYLPLQQTVSDIRLAFIQKDYTGVVNMSKRLDSKLVSAEDKYIMAYSVVMTEPFTTQQKTQLSTMSTQSNEDYLRFWVVIGQQRIDEAMDIASYLDDPQLLMYSITKKVDEIQRNPNISAEDRTNQINSYKTKLEELKKQYFEPLSESSDSTSSATSHLSESSSSTPSHSEPVVSESSDSVLTSDVTDESSDSSSASQ